MYALRIVAVAIVLATATLAGAQAEKPARVALVIGNGNYADAALPNAINDGADVAKELKAAGFEVIQRENATRKEMVLALREFGDRLGRNSTGVFYFAGHGMQVRGRNYLIPVDADIAREDEVAFAAVDLAAVMEKLDSARNPVNLVILDACRSNPFGKRFASSAQGLAQVDAPAGTLIAFSTAPGSVAADGTGRNGLYTRHLLEQMRMAIPVEEAFKAVRAAVRKDSAGRQIPWESTSLESHFAFRAPAPKPMPPKVSAQGPASAQPASTSRGAVSPWAPPVFAPGDTWVYRVRNLLDQSERMATTKVREIRGAEVLWNNEQTSDLLGNFVRSKKGESRHTHTPSTHMYVFPLTPGAKYTLPVVQDIDGKRQYDMDVTIAVVGEEEIATPAGKFRAVKIDRQVRWKQRGKPSNSGVNTYTYWYSGQAKRWVVSEQNNVTSEGKRLQSERWELDSYQVK